MLRHSGKFARLPRKSPVSKKYLRSLWQLRYKRRFLPCSTKLWPEPFGATTRLVRQSDGAEVLRDCRAMVERLERRIDFNQPTLRFLTGVCIASAGGLRVSLDVTERLFELTRLRDDVAEAQPKRTGAQGVEAFTGGREPGLQLTQDRVLVVDEQDAPQLRHRQIPLRCQPGRMPRRRAS